MGTGVASYIAAKFKCRSLILETPYYSIPSLMSNYTFIYPTSRMSHYKFPVGEYLHDVTVPVLLFAGKKDKVIPYRNAKRLQNSLKKGDQFITIPEAGHNNIIQLPEYKEKVDRLLNG